MPSTEPIDSMAGLEALPVGSRVAYISLVNSMIDAGEPVSWLYEKEPDGFFYEYTRVRASRINRTEFRYERQPHPFHLDAFGRTYRYTVLRYGTEVEYHAISTT